MSPQRSADSPNGGLAVSTNNLGKHYLLGELHAGSKELKEAVGEAVGRLLGRGSQRRQEAEDGIWAVRHATFDISPGESVAIIGRNGSGKSTLLRMLARATPPTEGSARLNGRVAPLLAVGAGFNPELTGRENIVMSGLMLGLTETQARERLGPIAEFSGVGRFLDTPVKRYSSGMYVRLAFSVACHVDAETLMADEVLAVGDAEFQQKCMDHMQTMLGQGKTLLFVSHNEAAVRALCTRALYLVQGEIVFDGGMDEALERYHASMTGDKAEAAQEPRIL